MLREQKNRMNLKILQMLRNKGAPELSPFPGEQGFESEGMDEDQFGDVVRGGQPELSPEKLKRKKRKSEALDFEPAQESVNIIGKP
jgi:hypothetical protein